MTVTGSLETPAWPSLGPHSGLVPADTSGFLPPHLPLGHKSRRAQLHPQRPSPVDSMSSKMGLSGGLGRYASSRLPRLTFGLGERPQGPCGPWLLSSPNPQELPPCHQKPAVCSTTSWAVSLASVSCHPHPGLLPTAEAALPAGAGGQCHSSLSILQGL